MQLESLFSASQDDTSYEHITIDVEEPVQKPNVKPLPIPKAKPITLDNLLISQLTHQLSQQQLIESSSSSTSTTLSLMYEIEEKSTSQIKDEKFEEFSNLIRSKAPTKQKPAEKKTSLWEKFSGKKEKVEVITYGNSYTTGDTVRLNGKDGKKGKKATVIIMS